MRPLLALEILTVIFVSDVLCGDPGADTVGSDTGEVKERRTSKFKESLKKHRRNKAQETDDELEYIREKLQKMGARWRKKLTVSKEQQEVLSNNLKKIGHREIETSRGNRIEDINAIADPDGYLYQGDIMLTREQVDALDQQGELQGGSRVKRQAINLNYAPLSLWKSFPIPFTLAANFTADSKRVILKAVAYWEANTCLTFKQNGVGNNSIAFFPGSGCWSYIGRYASRAEQEISIQNDGCAWVDKVIHEVGHALGFFHTQSRHDRDDYVTINFNNILDSHAYNYDKESTTTNYNYGLPYDYGSVMHYSMSAFAINNSVPAMYSKDMEHLYTMGSGRDGSFYDVLMMNKLYNCLDKCNGVTTTTCQNGGYMDPNNCTICKCPGGYGGNDCSQRPGCGETLDASATYQSKTSVVVGNFTGTVHDEWLECTYWITAPPGKRIEVQITSISTYKCYESCYYGGIEFKTMEDQRLTGYRYCCQEDVNKTLTTDVNPFPIIVFDRATHTSFSMLYRYVSSTTAAEQTTTTTAPSTTTPFAGPSRATAEPTKTIPGNGNCSTFYTATIAVGDPPIFINALTEGCKKWTKPADIKDCTTLTTKIAETIASTEAYEEQLRQMKNALSTFTDFRLIQERVRFLGDVQLGNWGSIDHFIQCPVSEIMPPRTTSKPPAMSPTPPAVVANECRTVESLLMPDKQGSSPMTKAVENACAGATPACTTATNLTLVALAKRIGTTVHSSAQSVARKVQSTQLLIQQFVGTIASRKAFLFPVMIGDWGTIGTFLNCTLDDFSK